MARVNTIVIVGGGTAGWVTAHQFLNKTNDDVKVVVISTPEKPIIGVGESTTGRFNDLITLKNCVTGLDEKEFLKETESTFKLGIKHTDWKDIGHSFWSPLGDNYYNDEKYPHEDYDNFRIYHVADNLDYDKTFQSQLMAQSRLHFKNDENVLHSKYPPVAYHLDTYKVGQYLKRKALESDRCSWINGELHSTQLDNKGFLSSVRCSTKEDKNFKVKGDLYIDCTGFARELIDTCYQNSFISYDHNLLVNRAITFNIENEEDKPIRNYTHAWAQKYGWLWEIPTQTRLGCGYVFDDRHTTPENAHDEIEKVLGKKIDIQKDISFKTGRMKKFWIRNVLSTGLSSGFIEPLEATSIHATITQITHFIENYYKQDLPVNNQLLLDKYNNEMGEMWDHIRDFISLHYCNARKDTSFWKDQGELWRVPNRLQNLLGMWEDRMPRTIDYISDKNNNFYHIGNSLMYHILIGMKVLTPTVAKQELIDYNLFYTTKRKYQKMTEELQNDMKNFVTTNEYYKSL